jgi:acyl-CoA synthetase (AMP-forming)/AMP-acid ligase II
MRSEALARAGIDSWHRPAARPGGRSRRAFRRKLVCNARSHSRDRVCAAYDQWGEEVKAVVCLQAGYTASAELAAELLEFCRARLAHFKCQRSVDFVGALRPGTTTASCANTNCARCIVTLRASAAVAR